MNLLKHVAGLFLLLSLFSGCNNNTHSNLDISKVIVSLSKTATTMDPYKPDKLGVTSLNSREFYDIQDTPNLTYSWSVDSASGSTGFSNPAEACKDIRFNGINTLNPEIIIDNPARWPKNSSVMLALTIGKNGVYNKTGKFKVTFFPDVSPFNECSVVLEPTTGIMDPNSLKDLGVTGFRTIGRDVTNLTPGVKYKWKPVAAFLSKYSTSAQAIQNVGLVKDDVLNPTVTLTNPSNWPNGSMIKFELEVEYEGIKNNTASFLLTFVPQSSPNVSIVLDPDHGVMNPYDLTELGVKSFYAIGMDLTNRTPGVKYKWSAESASGYALGFVSQDHALYDVGLVDNTEFNPVVTLKHPQYWTNGSAVIFKLEVEYPGLSPSNNSARFILTFNTGADFADSRVILYPESTTMHTGNTRDFGVQGFTVVGNGVNHTTRGVTLNWKPVGAFGYTGFTSEVKALEDVTISNVDFLNPVLTLKTPANWPLRSGLMYQLEIDYLGRINKTSRFLVSFGDDCGESNDGWSASKSVKLFRDSAYVPLYIKNNPIGIVNWVMMGSTADSRNIHIKYEWEVLDVLNHAEATTFTSKQSAINDVVIANKSALNPSISFLDITKWQLNGKLGAQIRLRLNMIYKNIRNSTATFLVTIDNQKGIIDGSGWSASPLSVSFNSFISRAASTDRSFNIGARGWSSIGTEITSTTKEVSYEWIPIAAAGFAGYGGKEENALSDIILTNERTLDPSIRFGNPSAWSTGSSVLFKVIVKYRGISNDSGRYYLAMDNSGTGTGWCANAQVILHPTSNEMDPFALKNLGVQRFEVVGSAINDLSNVTYEWKPIGAFGYDASKFASPSAAVADVGFRNNTEKDPFPTLNSPEYWIKGSMVLFEAAITCNGITNRIGRFWLSLKPETWNEFSQVILNPIKTVMNPFELPKALGVIDFKVAGLNLNTSSSEFKYEWTPIDVHIVGETFDNEQNAKNDVSFFSSAKIKNPWIQLRQPVKWLNTSYVVFEAAITYNNITNRTGRFTVTFQTPGTDPDPMLIGVDTMDPNIPKTLSPNWPGSVEHVWEVVSAANSGFNNDTVALRDIVLTNTDSMNPVISVKTPENWDNASSVVLQMKGNDGAKTYDGQFFVDFKTEAFTVVVGSMAADPAQRNISINPRWDGEIVADWDVVLAGGEGAPSSSLLSSAAQVGKVNQMTTMLFVVPEKWPNGTSVALDVWFRNKTKLYKGIYTVVFQTSGASYDVVHDGAVMDPKSPFPLPVKWTGAIVPEGGWNVANVDPRYHAFSNQGAALSDITFARMQMTPAPQIKTPDNWKPGSCAILEIWFTSEGRQKKGVFTLAFNDGRQDDYDWENEEIVILPDDAFRVRNPKCPYPQSLKIEGWYAKNNTNLSSSTPGLIYSWYVDSVSSNGGNPNEILIFKTDSFNPSIMVLDPNTNAVNWPLGSWVTLKCRITYKGKDNTALNVTIQFDPNVPWLDPDPESEPCLNPPCPELRPIPCWDGKKQVTFQEKNIKDTDELTITPGTTFFVSSKPPADLGIAGFSVWNCPEMTHNVPGVTYQWSIKRASYINIKKVNGKDEAEEIEILPGEFTLSNSNKLSPSLKLNKWRNFPNLVIVDLMCTIGYQAEGQNAPVYNSTGTWHVGMQFPYVKVDPDESEVIISGKGHCVGNVKGFKVVGLDNASYPSSSSGISNFHWEVLAFYDGYDQSLPGYVPGRQAAIPEEIGFFHGYKNVGLTEDKRIDSIPNQLNPTYVFNRVTQWWHTKCSVMVSITVTDRDGTTYIGGHNVNLGLPGPGECPPYDYDFIPRSETVIEVNPKNIQPFSLPSGWSSTFIEDWRLIGEGASLTYNPSSQSFALSLTNSSSWPDGSSIKFVNTMKSGCDHRLAILTIKFINKAEPDPDDSILSLEPIIVVVTEPTARVSLVIPDKYKIVGLANRVGESWNLMSVSPEDYDFYPDGTITLFFDDLKSFTPMLSILDWSKIPDRSSMTFKARVRDINNKEKSCEYTLIFSRKAMKDECTYEEITSGPVTVSPWTKSFPITPWQGSIIEPCGSPWRVKALSVAGADVTLSGANTMSPTLTLSDPSVWTNGSQIQLEVCFQNGGANYHGTFTLVFYTDPDDLVPVMYPNSSVMDPYFPTSLGVEAFYLEHKNTGERIILNSRDYLWDVGDTYRGVKNNISLLDNKVMDPKVDIKNPETWVNGYAEFQGAIEYPPNSGVLYKGDNTKFKVDFEHEDVPGEELELRVEPSVITAWYHSTTIPFYGTNGGNIQFLDIEAIYLGKKNLFRTPTVEDKSHDPNDEYLLRYLLLWELDRDINDPLTNLDSYIYDVNAFRPSLVVVSVNEGVFYSPIVYNWKIIPLILNMFIGDKVYTCKVNVVVHLTLSH